MPPTPSTLITTVSDATFDAEVLDSPTPTLVDFWAEWCGPCRRVAPELEHVSATENRMRVAKLNVDDSPATATRYGVMSIPTLVLFVGGKERARIVGAADRDAILARVEPHLR